MKYIHNKAIHGSQQNYFFYNSDEKDENIVIF